MDKVREASDEEIDALNRDIERIFAGIEGETENVPMCAFFETAASKTSIEGLNTDSRSRRARVKLMTKKKPAAS